MQLTRPTINGKRSDVWYVVWTEGRRSRRVSTKTTDKVRAKAFLAQFETIESAPPENFTVADLCDAYLADRVEHGVAYPKAIENCFRHIKPHFGALPPSMVSRLTVKAYTAQRRSAGVMDSTIDKELRFLRQALKFAKRDGWSKDEAPHVETPGASPPRQRFLQRHEFAAIYFHASPLHLRVFLGLAIDTLARGKHILALTWDRVDFDNGIIWYQPHRPGSNKRIQPSPISGRLRPLLERARDAALSPYVVEWDGKRVKSVRRAYSRAVSRAGIMDAHKHDLRRSGASWAVQGGVSFDKVAALLGDSVEMTEKTYAVFSPGYLGEVVDSIAEGSGGMGRRA